MDFWTDAISELEALDSIPARDSLPPHVLAPDVAIGATYGPALEITDPAQADEWLRNCVLHELRFRTIVEKDADGCVRPRACTFREAFARARQGIAWFAFAVDVSTGQFAVRDADGKRRVVETRANRDHVERMFGAVWVEPQRQEDEAKAQLKTRRYKAAKVANVVNWEARRAPAQPQPPKQGGLFE